MTALSRIVDAAHFILYNDELAQDALSYLDGRVSRAIQKQFKFGYLPKLGNLNNISSLLNEGDLEEGGIVFESFSSKANTLEHHNLIFPYKNCYGDILGVIGRTYLNSLTQKELNISKYKYSSGLLKDLHLFAMDESLPHILERDKAFIVEGQFDALACIEAGLPNTVALGGAHMSTTQFFKLSRCTQNLCFILDNDEAGQKGIKKIRAKYSQHANLSFIKLPVGYKDIDDCLRNFSDKTKFVTFLNNLHQGEDEKESLGSLSKYVQ